MYQTGNANFNPMTSNNPMNDQIIASDLLSGVKAGIKSTAAALTETATPEVHHTLEQQLQQGLQFHQQLTQFMMNKGWYQPYDVPQMIQSDLQQTTQVHQSINQGQQQSNQSQQYTNQTQQQYR